MSTCVFLHLVPLILHVRRSLASPRFFCISDRQLVFACRPNVSQGLHANKLKRNQDASKRFSAPNIEKPCLNVTYTPEAGGNKSYFFLCLTFDPMQSHGNATYKDNSRTTQISRKTSGEQYPTRMRRARTP